MAPKRRQEKTPEEEMFGRAFERKGEIAGVMQALFAIIERFHLERGPQTQQELRQAMEIQQRQQLWMEPMQQPLLEG